VFTDEVSHVKARFEPNFISCRKLTEYFRRPLLLRLDLPLGVPAFLVDIVLDYLCTRSLAGQLNRQLQKRLDAFLKRARKFVFLR